MTDQRTNVAAQQNALKSLRFGLEIETIGATRAVVASVIQSHVGGTVRHMTNLPRCYDPYHVTAADGRVWIVTADSSLSASFARQAEIVAPICTYKDMELIQAIVRDVKKVARATVDESCGIHVHVDTSGGGAEGAGSVAMTAAQLRNTMKSIYKQEELIRHTVPTCRRREFSGCPVRWISEDFIKRICKIRNITMQDIQRAWYGREYYSVSRYCNSRYAGVNLNAMFFRGAIEFRWFDSTLHAGKVKSYIQLCLALVAKGLLAKGASAKRRTLDTSTAKYDLRVVLIGLGLIGDEFKTLRHHMTKRLEGTSATQRAQTSAPIAPSAISAISAAFQQPMTAHA